ncbi:MAG: trypsin-like serine peptidase [Stackebrandtia sp.]
MRLKLPPRGRRVQQALAVGAAPALVMGLALVAISNPANASHTDTQSNASPDRAKPAFVSKSVSDQTSRAARLREYWTPERMANAVPADRLTQGAVPTAAPSTDTMKATTGSQPVQPTAAASSARKVRKSKTIGKVFFKTRSGIDMVCSGAAVNSKAKNMVMTAGHCVHSGPGKGWHKNWIFVPGYGPGNTARNGIYPATRLVALRGWIKKENFNDDVALALVKPGRGTNTKLVRKVGGYGTQFGRSYRRTMTAIGYSQLGFKGDKQKHCRKMTHRRRGTGQIEMRCRVLTPGASGGPWVKGKVAAGKGFVNGINSNVNKRRHPTVIRSSYFGKDVYRMYQSFRKTKH